jgi:hypothetical protein
MEQNILKFGHFTKITKHIKQANNDLLSFLKSISNLMENVFVAFDLSEIKAKAL